MTESRPAENHEVTLGRDPVSRRDDSGAALLAEGGVLVWHARLEETTVSWMAGALDCLSAEERERADRFRVDDARHLFVLGRIMLRQLAGVYLDARPADVRLELGTHGKPRFAAVHATTLHFNIAHSGTAVVIAFADGRDIGVDVERLRPLSDRDALIDRYFAPAERDALMRIPAAARDSAFFTCWARKEALLKAWSAGLTLPLESFDVPVPPSPSAFPAVCRHPRDDGAWWLWDLDADHGYAAALAVRRIGTPPGITLWRWPEAGLIPSSGVHD